MNRWHVAIERFVGDDSEVIHCKGAEFYREEMLIKCTENGGIDMAVVIAIWWIGIGLLAFCFQFWIGIFIGYLQGEKVKNDTKEFYSFGAIKIIFAIPIIAFGLITVTALL